MFTVPLIPPDLRHEETIIQAAYALDCLQKTINTIFERIDKRIEKNNVKVGELQDRINKSQEKIKSLQGTRKAIHIYAPARFPASHIFKEIPVTFKKTELSGSETNGNEIYEVKSKVEQNLPNINEKLIFFHVRENHHPAFDHSITKERVKIKQTQDLGTIPKELRSVSSVLQFNSNYSPYCLDETEGGTGGQTDNWKRAKLFNSKRHQKSPNSSHTATPKQILEPAPHSLAHRNEKLTPSGGLKYTPKLSEAPELNLPMDLPDLPGIADDLRYESQEAKQKIAPSLEMVVESLPDLKELLTETQETLNIPSYSKNDNTVVQAPKPLVATTPPPPPPMPPALATAAPPPPPPPPSVLPQKKQTAPPAKSVSSPDTRSELMAAIRNAGGAGKAHLRATAAAPLVSNNFDVVDTKQTDTTINQRKSAPNASGDLMADLHNKLLMRRKGISGSKETNAGDQSTSSRTPSGNPVISRLSSLIPPPPPVQPRTTSEDDEDSNDAEWVD